MGDIFYIITRVFIKNGSESHSVEIKDNRRQATQRFYNIVAADLADNSVTYQFVSLCDNYGNLVDGLKPVVYDRRPEPNV